MIIYFEFNKSIIFDFMVFNVESLMDCFFYFLVVLKLVGCCGGKVELV